MIHYSTNMKELIPRLSSFSSSHASSSSFTYRRTYDVFLNFRGEDTRNNFTGYLYDALCKKGIHTFMDDELKRGEEITPALLQTIDISKISIVILSVNYASSTFCLDELVKILECKKQKNQLVLPIFYKVDPSDVRKLQGSYQEALTRHEATFKYTQERVQNWKSALHEVANLSGWHFTERDGYEHTFVKNIVAEVSKRINHIIFHIAKHHVGLKSQVKNVISLLDFGCNEEVVMVGIYGIGGIGKTTIAYAIFNDIFHQFEDVCFLSDVRKHGLVELQKTLLLELIGDKEINIDNVRKGISIISMRLCQKKVLLFLDDVDNLKQLEALAGGVDWFGSGSRIIITTRDKHLLDVHGVNRNYEVNELCFDEALELFSWHAFQNKEVDSSYSKISNHVIEYCKGLPLALEIIGSHLFAKTQKEWKSALDMLKKIPSQEIQEVLKVSYDGLEQHQREIFLDIVCYFKSHGLSYVKGHKLSYVKNILQNGCGYDPEHHIAILVKKSLIKIDQYQEVRIHDLMAQMGKEIIRNQSQNPGNWSRLWNYEDILHVLEGNKETDKIEVIVLNMPQCEKVQWNGKAFKKMKNLRILIIESACFSCGPQYLPNSLRVLKWENYPSSALPSDFHLRKLTILGLRGSALTSIKPLKNFTLLTEMNLRNCQSLIQVPDVSGAVNLRALDISHCPNLIEVHKSVGFLDKLVILDVSDCPNLSTLPCSIKSTSFQSLVLSRCFSLQNVPEITRFNINLTSFRWHEALEGAGEEGFLYLGESFYGLVFQCCLSMLPIFEKWKGGFEYFSGDNEERTDPTMSIALQIGEFGHKQIVSANKYFSTWHPYYYRLTSLTLQFCNLTDEFLHQRLAWFPNLKYLDLTGNKFTILPECMNKCESQYLKTLILNRCENLKEIKGIPLSIKFCSTVKCVSLTSQSMSKLWNQDFCTNRVEKVIIPGIRIPKWLDHCCEGSSIHYRYRHCNKYSKITFWYRNKFPRLALLSYVKDGQLLFIDIYINGILHVGPTYRIGGSSLQFPNYGSKLCTSLLNYLFDPYGWADNEQGKIILKKNEWNHVEVTTNCSLTRVYVYEEEIDMNNVLFVDPDSLQSTDSISYNRDPIILSKQFCSFLGMQVLDTIDSIEQDKNYYHYLNSSDEFVAPSIKEYLQGAIWIMEAPTTVKVLMLKILECSLPTCGILFCRKLVNSPVCPICEEEIETIEHVFTECPWTRSIWFGSDFGRILKYGTAEFDLENDWPHPIFRYIENRYPNAERATGLMGKICWAIWKARNEFVLNDKPVDPREALETVKAIHKSYSFKTSRDTVYQDLQHNKYFISINSENGKSTEAEYKARPKRKLVSNSNIEIEPTCDKGTEHESKVKRKRNGESSNNTKVEPTHDEVFKSIQVYKELTSQEIDDKQNVDISESKEKVDPVKNKGKYTERLIYEFDNIFPEISPKSAKSIQINPMESHKVITRIHEKFDLASLNITQQEIQEEIRTAPTQEPINEKFKQMVEARENQNPIDVVNDDFEFSECLESVHKNMMKLSFK